MILGDHHTFEEFKQGNLAAFEKFFEYYKRPITLFANSILKNRPEICEEIVSECFVKAWTRRSDFENEGKLQAFLYVVAKNACFSTLKAAHNNNHIDIASLSEHMLKEDPYIVNHLIREETLALLREEVDKLPASQKHVIQLSYYENKDIPSICNQLKISSNSAYANYSRAVSTLKKKFQNKKDWLF